MVAGGNPSGHTPLPASPYPERAMLGACAGSASRFVLIEPGSWWRSRNEAEQIECYLMAFNLGGATMSATPYIDGFGAATNIGPDSSGLNSYNGSTNYVIITGNDMASGYTVNIFATTALSWSGPLGAYDNQQQGWPAALICKNTSTGLGDTLNVDVTVTNSEGGTSNKLTVTLPVASVAPIGSGPK
jgi:hypothetical protein